LSKICPVLVQITDPKLINLTVESSKKFDPERDFAENEDHYLMQLWSSKGHLIYERHTQTKITQMWTSEIEDPLAKRLKSSNPFGESPQKENDAIGQD
jgi:hypothetical protein